MKEEKILQIVNLSPSEDWVEKIVEVHPMKQIFWASIIQGCVFGFMLFSFWGISIGLEAEELDLRIPETDFDFRQIEEDSLLVQEAINKRLRFIDVKNEPTKRQLKTFYILNFIDMTTSYYMVNNHPHMREANPLLPDHPSAGQFLTQKFITAPLIAANFEEGQIVFSNWILGVVIIKNLFLYNSTSECEEFNYHHTTGANVAC